ncbi:MAG: hypothetical protein WBY44_23810, partial [Bryobacteraceae bacterium]
GREAWAVLAASVVLEAPAGPVVSAVLVAWVAWAVTGPRLYRRRVALGRMGSATGVITPHIAAARPIQTALRQIGLVVALAVTRSPNARQAPGNKLPVRVEG